MFTSGLAGDEFGVPRRLFDQCIVRAAVSEDPILHNNDAATNRLVELATTAHVAPLPTAPKLAPNLADEVSGVRYTFEPNDGGFAWVEFEFGGDEMRMRLEDVDGPIDVAVGLDNVFRISNEWGNPWALMGEWTSDNSFKTTWQIIGGASRGAFDFSFTGDDLAMAFHVAVTGSTTRALRHRTG